ncbi:MFS transporter [Catellatospora sp. NPDC049111]|uniref:MFS transporter n=1 Tax=Catellatospora sp. NPDC049111 TaxID=3155271 RepID=UPI0033DF00B6
MPSSPRRSGATLTFVLLALAAVSLSLLQSLVSPVLPVIQHDLDTTQSAMSWTLIAWLLSAAVSTPILGRLGDMIGKQHSLVVVLSAIVVGNVVAALAPNIGVLVAGRVIQGLGGAVFPLSFGIIRDEFAPRRVPSAIGALSGVIAVGSGLGTVLAGPITETLGWRWLFWIPAAVVAATAVLCKLFIPESPIRTGGRINLLSATLLTTWLVALLLPVSLGRTWGWDSPATIALFALAVLSFTLWAIAETRSTNPLIDMRMMRQPLMLTANTVGLLFGASMLAAFTFLPQFLETPSTAGYGFGASVTAAGLLILPMLVTMAIGGLISGPIHHVVGFKAQVATGSALIAAACAGFGLLNTAPWQLATGGAVFGLGLGIAYAAITSLIVQGANPAQTGIATGMNTNIRTIGGSIGIAVVTAIVTSDLQPSGLPAKSGYTTGFLLVAAVAAAAGVVALLVPTARPTTPETHEVPASRHAAGAESPGHSEQQTSHGVTAHRDTSHMLIFAEGPDSRTQPAGRHRSAA